MSFNRRSFYLLVVRNLLKWKTLVKLTLDYLENKLKDPTIGHNHICSQLPRPNHVSILSLKRKFMYVRTYVKYGKLGQTGSYN